MISFHRLLASHGTETEQLVTARLQRSLGYEQYDVRLLCLRRAAAPPPSATEHHVGPPRMSRLQFVPPRLVNRSVSTANSRQLNSPVTRWITLRVSRERSGKSA